MSLLVDSLNVAFPVQSAVQVNTQLSVFLNQLFTLDGDSISLLVLLKIHNHILCFACV